jgi:release factor glutamine methyltransferase
LSDTGAGPTPTSRPKSRPKSTPSSESKPGPTASRSSEKSWTILELLRWTTDHFTSAGIETPRLDAECLLAHALGMSRLELYVAFEKPATPDERARYRALVVRRASERVPVSLLVGQREFWSLQFKVTADVLTPRPDTETLVEAALARIPDAGGAFSVLDLGTGSGAIALALAKERPNVSITATDISPEALQIARLNADELHIAENVRFEEGSLFGPVSEERFDLIVSNPPYLARGASADLPPELVHEPELALFGGEDGFEVLRPLVTGVADRLVPGGSVLVEIDPGQAETVAGWFAEAGLSEVEILNDLSRRPRVVAGRLPGNSVDRASS